MTRYDRDVLAGMEWEHEILSTLEAADVVLLLVSPDFIDSDYCFAKETPQALAKYAAGKGTVVPVIVRPTPSWNKHLDLGKHAALPDFATAVTEWASEDQAWAKVETGLTDLVEHLCKLRGLA